MPVTGTMGTYMRFSHSFNVTTVPNAGSTTNDSTSIGLRNDGPAIASTVGGLILFSFIAATIAFIIRRFVKESAIPQQTTPHQRANASSPPPTTTACTPSTANKFSRTIQTSIGSALPKPTQSTGLGLVALDPIEITDGQRKLTFTERPVTASQYCDEGNGQENDKDVESTNLAIGLEPCASSDITRVFSRDSSTEEKLMNNLCTENAVEQNEQILDDDNGIGTYIFVKEDTLQAWKEDSKYLKSSTNSTVMNNSQISTSMQSEPTDCKSKRFRYQKWSQLPIDGSERKTNRSVLFYSAHNTSSEKKERKPYHLWDTGLRHNLKKRPDNCSEVSSVRLTPPKPNFLRTTHLGVRGRGNASSQAHRPGEIGNRSLVFSEKNSIINAFNLMRRAVSRKEELYRPEQELSLESPEACARDIHEWRHDCSNLRGGVPNIKTGSHIFSNDVIRDSPQFVLRRMSNHCSRQESNEVVDTNKSPCLTIDCELKGDDDEPLELENFVDSCSISTDTSAKAVTNASISSASIGQLDKISELVVVDQTSICHTVPQRRKSTTMSMYPMHQSQRRRISEVTCFPLAALRFDDGYLGQENTNDRYLNSPGCHMLDPIYNVESPEKTESGHVAEISNFSSQMNMTNFEDTFDDFDMEGPKLITDRNYTTCSSVKETRQPLKTNIQDLQLDSSSLERQQSSPSHRHASDKTSCQLQSWLARSTENDFVIDDINQMSPNMTTRDCPIHESASSPLPKSLNEIHKRGFPVSNVCDIVDDHRSTPDSLDFRFSDSYNGQGPVSPNYRNFTKKNFAIDFSGTGEPLGSPYKSDRHRSCEPSFQVFPPIPSSCRRKTKWSDSSEESKECPTREKPLEALSTDTSDNEEFEANDGSSTTASPRVQLVHFCSKDHPPYTEGKNRPQAVNENETHLSAAVFETQGVTEKLKHHCKFRPTENSRKSKDRNIFQRNQALNVVDSDLTKRLSQNIFKLDNIVQLSPKKLKRYSRHFIV